VRMAVAVEVDLQEADHDGGLRFAPDDLLEQHAQDHERPARRARGGGADGGSRARVGRDEAARHSWTSGSDVVPTPGTCLDPTRHVNGLPRRATRK